MMTKKDFEALATEFGSLLAKLNADGAPVEKIAGVWLGVVAVVQVAKQGNENFSEHRFAEAVEKRSHV
jgi:hypothetical protein